MAGELKNSVARSVAWSIAEKSGTLLLQTAVSIITLRLLMPSDFGLVAILTAFSAVALIVVDSGFSQTLIRKPEPEQSDYKSVFVFNIAVSLLLYLLCVGVSFPAARFYDMPMLTVLAPVFFLQLPVNALCVIQNTLFTRQFRFALLSKIVFASSLVSGVVAILMALAGCGVWSIVAQRVIAMLVRALLLWWFSRWRPTAAYDGQSLKRMAPYSLNLMATDLITTIYNKIPQLFLGRMYPANMLGYFDQAQKLKDFPVTSTMQAVQNVTFPALSKITDNDKKFDESYRQVSMVVAYVMFPLMTGLICVTGEAFGLLLGEKWMPTVPYFEVICLTGLFAPLSVIAYNVLKVRSNGKIIVRLEIAKKIVMTIILAITIPQSIIAVVWGLVVMSACEFIINFTAATCHCSLPIWKFIRTILPIVLITMAMFVAIRTVGIFVDDGSWLRFAVEIVVGFVTYTTLSAMFRLEAFREVVNMIKKQVAK